MERDPKVEWQESEQFRRDTSAEKRIPIAEQEFAGAEHTIPEGNPVMGAAETSENLNLPAQEEMPTILIVDEHFVTAEIERNYLASVGFSVHLATSKQSMEDILHRHHIDLLIIDQAFGRKQGLSIMQEAKRISKNNEIKAIVTSVEAHPQIRKKVENAGADAFLVKPAPRPKVLKEIKKLTSQKARDTERVKQHIELTLKFQDRVHVARTLDISSDGLHLQLADGSEQPAVGARVSMGLPVGKSGKPLQLEGVVVRHTKEGFGVRFEDMGILARRELDKFILRFSMEFRASQYYL